MSDLIVKRPTLTVTVGLPASGKTTWAKSQTGAVRVNRDDLRRMFHGGWTGEDWAERHVTIAQMAAVRALLDAGVDVIVDDTNLRRRVLRDLRRLAVLAGADFVLKDFTWVPMKDCIDRDARRDGDAQVGAEVIQSMFDRYLKELNGAPFVLADEAQDPAGELVAYVAPPGGVRAVIVDIDGTVARMGDRSPFDESRVHADRPVGNVINAVRALHGAGNKIVFMSGRTDGCRAETEKWLAEHIGVPYEALFMRPAGDNREDSIVKRELFDEHVRYVYDVEAVLDDRSRVVAMWRSLGLTVFQVADGDF